MGDGRLVLAAGSSCIAAVHRSQYPTIAPHTTRKKESKQYDWRRTDGGSWKILSD